jgi:hypothetical protein
MFLQPSPVLRKATSYATRPKTAVADKLFGWFDASNPYLYLTFASLVLIFAIFPTLFELVISTPLILLVIGAVVLAINSYFQKKSTPPLQTIPTQPPSPEKPSKIAYFESTPIDVSEQEIVEVTPKPLTRYPVSSFYQATPLKSPTPWSVPRPYNKPSTTFSSEIKDVTRDFPEITSLSASLERAFLSFMRKYVEEVRRSDEKFRELCTMSGLRFDNTGKYSGDGNVVSVTDKYLPHQLSRFQDQWQEKLSMEKKFLSFMSDRKDALFTLYNWISRQHIPIKSMIEESKKGLYTVVKNWLTEICYDINRSDIYIGDKSSVGVVIDSGVDAGSIYVLYKQHKYKGNIFECLSLYLLKSTDIKFRNEELRNIFR